MIKYNTKTINDWNFGASNVIKVYRNNAIVFYKFSGESPTPEWKVCFAVVDDISQYTDREFEDVFDNATEKWYKLNNLNQYEEYGVYGSGRTSCEGSASRLPQGYTEVEYVENTGTTSSNGAYLNLGLPLYDTIGNSFVISSRLKSEFYSASGYDDLETIINSESVSSPYYGFAYRYEHSTHNIVLSTNPSNHATLSTTANTDGTTSLTISCNSTSVTDQVPLGLFASYNANYNTPYRFAIATIYSLTVVKNGDTVRDLVPAKRNSDDKYGMYDIVNDVFYVSPNGNNFIGGDPVTPTDCVTTYEGKLTIDDGYEYEWNGSSWVNVGEVSGSTRVPAGYKEVEYIQNTGTSYINTNFKPNQDTRIVCTMQCVTSSQYGRYFGAGGYNTANAMQFDYESGAQGILHISWGHIAGWTTYSSCVGDYNVHTYDWDKNYFYRDKGETNQFSASTTYTAFQCVANLGIFCHINDNGTAASSQNECMVGKMYSFQIYDNSTLVRDFVPCKRDSDSKYGVYDVVNNTFYSSANSTALSGGSETGSTEYPKYYSEKSEPLNDLTFNTLAEAQTYAYNNCVYDGMKATIDGDRYYFDSEDDNGWVKILEYYKFEDVTPNAASGWTISRSETYNPDSSYYDDFDLETSWTSNSTKIAKVTIYGYDHFTYYLRSYHGYSSYVYLVATNVDEISTPPSTMGYNSSSAITNTYYWNKSPKSDVNLSNYRRVTYNNLDKTVEHTFYVYFYGRTYNYVGNATILIPKEQTNENWEQVTFSASSNVASFNKNLYIDGNNSTSGGTGYWYNRWIVGLPSGSHSSYTNYSVYSYCPSVTSSTFTSVAGEQRQVNFTYDSTTNKSLACRLVDTSGNVLTPSDTVYYNVVGYNSCGVSANWIDLTFPINLTVKVGGSFSFNNSSNRHYIYGYQPPTLGTRYYVDNYQSTFDITYTKLSEEAVTITYTTYDPSDTEVPSFKTDITYPYSGGTTSSTTLASYAVPYTYPYKVSQTSVKFSADSQEYTASQATRTISFILYPNNREFATVADMEAYQYAWEGMKATVGDTNYVYKNGEWVEQSYTQYEYIRTSSASTQYYTFNTNFYPTTANTLEVKFEMTDTSVDWGNLVSWNKNQTANQFFFGTVTGSYQAIVRTGGNNGVSYRPTIGANKVVVYTLPLSAISGTYSVDGGAAQTIQYNYTAMQLPSTVSMRFFGNDDGSSVGKSAAGKMYYVKVYDGNGNLVKHYVPSDNNGTPCFYEIVDGEYIMDTYTGSNHGTLTLGPEV